MIIIYTFVNQLIFLKILVETLSLFIKKSLKLININLSNKNF